MAQPAKILVDWRVGILVNASQSYQASDISVVGVNIVEIRSETSTLSIDGYDAFTVKYGEQIFFNAASKYIFTTDCEIAFGIIVTVV